MNSILKSLIMFVYPARCRCCGENLDPSHGYYICSRCWNEKRFISRPYCEICGHPLNPEAALPDKIYSCKFCPKEIHFRKARSIVDYDSAVGEAIRLLKYHNKIVMAKRLGELMFELMPCLFDDDYDFIIPVPIHKKKYLRRGYNQVEVIGRILSCKVGIPLETKCLIKIKDTPSQTSLDIPNRIKNVRGSFEVVDAGKLANKKILLIDDVMTTGATVNECSRILNKKSKVKYIDVFTIARRIMDKKSISYDDA